MVLRGKHDEEHGSTMDCIVSAYRRRVLALPGCNTPIPIPWVSRIEYAGFLCGIIVLTDRIL